jgi:hypothetical protein
MHPESLTTERAAGCGISCFWKPSCSVLTLDFMQKIIEAALLDIRNIFHAKSRTPSSPFHSIASIRAGMAQATCGTGLGKCIILLGNLYISWNHHQIHIYSFPNPLFQSHHIVYKSNLSHPNSHIN